MILAIDTATDQASVALSSGNTILAELSWTTRGNHSSHLDRVLPELFRLAAISTGEVTFLVVARGPGSFNGLRVGISLAKGLAFALRRPLVGISSLDVIAWQAAEARRSVWALLPAGRGEMYRGRYYDAGSSWRQVGEHERLPIQHLLAQYEERVLLAGEGSEAVAAELAARSQKVARAVSVRTFRRAGYLAELGKDYFATNGVDQADALEPLYLRRSSAEENRSARHGE